MSKGVPTLRIKVYTIFLELYLTFRLLTSSTRCFFAAQNDGGFKCKKKNISQFVADKIYDEEDYVGYITGK